jgi:divalent metal cation (Fe/Co/Zn/Cd) transporter
MNHAAGHLLNHCHANIIFTAMKVAKERKSSVLASNAVHHRVDSLTGIVTLFAILGANLLHEASWLDPVGGFLISLLVIKAGWGNTAASLYELADKGIDEEMRGSVQRHAEYAFAELPQGIDVVLKEVQGVKSGQNYLIDLELAVPKNWTVVDNREVEDAVRSRIGSKVRGVRRVKVRFVSKDDLAPSLFDEFISGDISPRESPEPEAGHDHDHDHAGSIANAETNGNSKKTK